MQNSKFRFIGLINLYLHAAIRASKRGLQTGPDSNGLPNESLVGTAQRIAAGTILRLHASWYDMLAPRQEM